MADACRWCNADLLRQPVPHDPRCPEYARRVAVQLQGYGHSVPQPVTDEWVEQAAAAGMIRRADLVDGAWYVGCCRNAYMARWFADGVPRAHPPGTTELDGKKVRALLATRAWTQEELAEKVGTHRVHLTRVLSGARPLSDKLRAKLTEVLGGGIFTTPDPEYTEPTRRGCFIHLREKFGQVFTETINHPEDDDGWDVFVPTLLVLGPLE